MGECHGWVHILGFFFNFKKKIEINDKEGGGMCHA